MDCKKNIDVKDIKRANVQANICHYSDRICATCWKYDPNYKGGWCDYNSHETTATSGCPDWKPR